MIRLRVLDTCLGDWNQLYKKLDLEIAVEEALGRDSVCPSTIDKDLAFLRKQYKARIERLPDKGSREPYFRYDRPGSYIDRVAEEDMALVRGALDTLRRLGTGSDYVEETIRRIEERFSLAGGPAGRVSFEHNDRLVGLELLAPAIEAVNAGTVLDITYQTYRAAEPEHYIFHPCYVKQYRNRWFLVGHKAGESKVTTLAFDRIKGFKRARVRFVPMELDFEAYFADIVGVSRPEGEAKRDIVLRFTPERYPYVRTKPLHSSQRETGECRVTITVIPTRELRQEILSFGADVEVVSPADYRREIGAVFAIAARRNGKTGEKSSNL